MNDELKKDLIDFDFYDETLKELNDIPVEKRYSTTVRDMLEDKLKAQYSKAQNGKITAILCAFYKFTKGNSEYAFLDGYYNNMLSFYFSPEKLERYVDLAAKNDVFLDRIINLDNDLITASLIKAVKTRRNMTEFNSNDDYKASLDRLEEKLSKVVSHQNFSGADLRIQRQKLEEEQRELHSKETLRQSAIVSSVSSKLGVDSQEVIRRLNQKGIDLKMVDSLTLGDNIRTFNASKVGNIRSEKFRRLVTNVRKANYLKNLNFEIGDLNTLTIDSKITMHDKMAMAKRNVVMKISSSAKKAKFAMKATAMLNTALLEKIRTSFKDLADFYKVCYELAKTNQVDIKAVGASKVGSISKDSLLHDEARKIA